MSATLSHAKNEESEEVLRTTKLLAQQLNQRIAQLNQEILEKDKNIESLVRASQSSANNAKILEAQIEKLRSEYRSLAAETNEKLAEREQVISDLTQ